MAYEQDRRSLSLRNQLSAVALQQLRYAVLSAEYGSFRRAADALFMRQSTLSRRIRQLEVSLGLTLFERSSGGICVTSAGQRFLRTAQSILEQMDALVTSSQCNGRGDAGRLSVGFYTSLSAGNLRATLVDFKQRSPQVELGMVERSRMRLISALRNGAIDIVIATDGGPEFDDKVLPLWSERILVALPEGHHLAAKKAVYWTDLRSETVLLSHYDPGRELEDLLMAKLVSTTDRPKIERHDVSRGIIKTLITIGLGVSLVAESDIGVNFAGVIYREMRDGLGPSQVHYSAHWRKDNDNPVLANFLKLLSERYPLPCAD
jgi:DNA-binding transcriptional LysR family regulator